MVLRAAKEILGLGEPLISLRVGSSQPIEISASARAAIPFVRPDWNIAEAQRKGIQPVNFHQLSEQLSKDDISNSVLFDTPPDGFHAGNHWRVTHVDDELDLVKIQLCTIFGNYDYRIPPFTVSQYDILFTGVTTERYEQNGKPIDPLSAVVKLVADSDGYPQGLILTKKTIYWTDSQGKLLPIAQHPLFNTDASPQARGKE
jgi:hypothetical protein